MVSQSHENKSYRMLVVTDEGLELSEHGFDQMVAMNGVYIPNKCVLEPIEDRRSDVVCKAICSHCGHILGTV